MSRLALHGPAGFAMLLRGSRLQLRRSAGFAMLPPVSAPRLCSPVPRFAAAAQLDLQFSLLGKASARRFIPFNGSFCRGRWGNWPDIKILVSGPPPEIVSARPSKADFAIRRAHKSALEERHVRAQILKFPDCQLLEHFLRAHVFALNMIPSSYDLQAGLITDLHSGELQITPECHLTIHVAT